MEVTITELPTIWEVRRGHGSFLVLEMGEKVEKRKLNGEAYNTGSHHLWITHCDWWLRVGGSEILNSERVGQDFEADMRALNSLSGQKSWIEIRSGSGLIRFDGGGVLELKASLHDPGELFHLFIGDLVITAL